MTIYYIAVSSWDGRAYTFDFIIPFLSKEKRNKCFEEMIASKQYGNADYNLVKGEENVSEIQNNPEGLEEANEKEVNLKDEIEKAFKEKFIDLVPASSSGITYNSYKKIARYFYLLGRKSL